MNTKFPSRIITRCQYASPFSAPPYGEGTIDKAGIVPHFNGGVETIGIDVNDFSQGAHFVVFLWLAIFEQNWAQLNQIAPRLAPSEGFKLSE